MSVAEAFGDFAEVLAAMAPEKVTELRAPMAMSERVEELVNKKKTDQLTEEEATELERYLSLDLLITLAKARAKKMLAA